MAGLAVSASVRARRTQRSPRCGGRRPQRWRGAVLASPRASSGMGRSEIPPQASRACPDAGRPSAPAAWPLPSDRRGTKGRSPGMSREFSAATRRPGLLRPPIVGQRIQRGPDPDCRGRCCHGPRRGFLMSDDHAQRQLLVQVVVAQKKPQITAESGGFSPRHPDHVGDFDTCRPVTHLRTIRPTTPQRRGTGTLPGTGRADRYLMRATGGLLSAMAQKRCLSIGPA